MDGTDILYTRFQMVFFDAFSVGFKNTNGYFLSSDLSWSSKEAGIMETFSFEEHEDFFCIKNLNLDYLTVSTDGDLSFEITTLPEDAQMFQITKLCVKGWTVGYNCCCFV